MKVLMLKKVPRVGNEGEVINVASGYALNFLFPKGFAKTATAKDEQAAADKKKKQGMKSNEVYGRSLEAKSILEKAGTLEFVGKVTDQGTLYASVAQRDIVKLIRDLTQIEIEPKNIEMEDHIKAIGAYTIKIRLSEKISAQMKLEVRAS